jgi:signal transduction histidine kinase/ActR/RegA family two-component response regulator
MKLKIAIAIISFLSISLLTFGQVENKRNLSNARIALVIDSLENYNSDIPNDQTMGVKYELSILYRSINTEQSIKYAHEYINGTTDKKTSPGLILIYGLLADIYGSENQIDSAFYYYSKQSEILAKTLSDKKEKLRNTYINNVTGNDSSLISWLSNTKTYIILLLITILIVLTGIYFISKKRFSKIESIKNHELEIANTKFKEFNEKLENAIRKNTGERLIELEKTNKEIGNLRKSLKKAEESNYLKNAFLGTMSHQIRTPLSGIMGFSDMLETELALRGNEELYEFASNIQEAGEKLMSLITNIIDISSIEANILELNITTCNLNKVVTDLEKNYELKAKEKNLIFKTKFESYLPTVEADIENLTKVLKIIIDNAIQYTNKGFVTISTAWEESSSKAHIEVRDKGIGIEKDTMKMLLDSFDYSKYGSSLTYQGHGLGLILAHRLITLMHGSLEIDSNTNDGTRVKITLQCTSDSGSTELSRQNTTKASIVNAPEYGRIKIFIVEDDRMNRLVLEKMLKKTGEVTTSSDGNNALKYLKKAEASNEHFDVMLIDINLPSPWDGITLMKEIRKQFPHMKNTPFIAQTAYAMAGDKDHYLDAGFNDYISKPINKNELLTMIQKQLELFKSNN